MLQTINKKDNRRTALLRKLELPRNTRSLILLDISDESIRSFLIEAGKYLNVIFITDGDMADQESYDACITDWHWNIDLVNLMKHYVIPIIVKDHPLSMSLSEFEPMKFQGNAFIYESMNPYLIFEKLVRYLENVRYMGDKRILLNNVGKTF